MQAACVLKVGTDRLTHHEGVHQDIVVSELQKIAVPDGRTRF